MRIQPARALRGRVRLPGDKSISHRAAIIAAMAKEGTARLRNFSTSADCASTLSTLRQLGVSVGRDGEDVTIERTTTPNSDGRRFHPSPDALDCGNSGSTMRMLAGALASEPYESILTGDASLRSRPMHRIIEPLSRMGAELQAEEGCAPLRVRGRRPLQSIRYEMPVASAQVKSAILLAGLTAEGRTQIVERRSLTRDHTERMLRWFGVEVSTEAEADGGDYGQTAAASISIEGMQEFAARDVVVPGDASSAAFLVAAAALLEGSRLEIEGVGLNPTRTEFLEVLGRCGAALSVEARRTENFEEMGDLIVRGTGGLSTVGGGENSLGGNSRGGNPLGGNRLGGSAIAALIDELPVLAVVGTQLEGGLEIREAGGLRVKESDRVAATVENLRAMGAQVEEFTDGLAVGGRQALRGARLKAHGDHRIAMAFTVAALVAEGETEIEGAECVAVSFPEFFHLLESVIVR